MTQHNQCNREFLIVLHKDEKEPPSNSNPKSREEKKREGLEDRWRLHIKERGENRGQQQAGRTFMSDRKRFSKCLNEKKGWTRGGKVLARKDVARNYRGRGNFSLKTLIQKD